MQFRKASAATRNDTEGANMESVEFLDEYEDIVKNLAHKNGTGTKLRSHVKGGQSVSNKMPKYPRRGRGRSSTLGVSQRSASGHGKNSRSQVNEQSAEKDATKKLVNLKQKYKIRNIRINLDKNEVANMLKLFQNATNKSLEEPQINEKINIKTEPEDFPNNNELQIELNRSGKKTCCKRPVSPLEIKLKIEQEDGSSKQKQVADVEQIKKLATIKKSAQKIYETSDHLKNVLKSTKRFSSYEISSRRRAYMAASAEVVKKLSTSDIVRNTKMSVKKSVPKTNKENPKLNYSLPSQPLQSVKKLAMNLNKTKPVSPEIKQPQKQREKRNSSPPPITKVNHGRSNIELKQREKRNSSPPPITKVSHGRSNIELNATENLPESTCETPEVRPCKNLERKESASVFVQASVTCTNAETQTNGRNLDQRLQGTAEQILTKCERLIRNEVIEEVKNRIVTMSCKYNKDQHSNENIRRTRKTFTCDDFTASQILKFLECYFEENRIQMKEKLTLTNAKQALPLNVSCLMNTTKISDSPSVLRNAIQYTSISSPIETRRIENGASKSLGNGEDHTYTLPASVFATPTSDKNDLSSIRKPSADDLSSKETGRKWQSPKVRKLRPVTNCVVKKKGVLTAFVKSPVTTVITDSTQIQTTRSMPSNLPNFESIKLKPLLNACDQTSQHTPSAVPAGVWT